MILIAPILLLVLTATLILAIRAVRPDFPALWLIAVLGSTASWVVTLFLRIRLPVAFTYLHWNSQSIFHSAPGLLLDYSSWPYAFAISSLVLTVILVSPGHLRDRSEVDNIAGSMALGGLGLLSVLAANPVSLLLGWAATDSIELFILLRSKKGEESQVPVIQVFATRIAGMMIALWTFVVGSKTAGYNTSFTDLSPQAGVPLLISIGLRVGIFPLHLPFTGDSMLRRGQGTLLRMVPAASGLVVLSRIPSSAITPQTANWLSVFVIIALLYAGVRWLLETDELTSRPFWLIAMTCFGILAVLQRKPEAALSWGATLVFLGSAVFLLEYASRFMRGILGIGVLSMLGLPFTANASGVAGLFTSHNLIWTALVWLGFFLIILGTVEKIRRKPDMPQAMEQIVYLTYPSSILLLILGYVFVGLFGWHGSRTTGNLWVSFLLLALLIAWIIFDRHTGKPAQGLQSLRSFSRENDESGISKNKWVAQVVDLQWVYTCAQYLYRGVNQFVNLFTFILEGSAGLFWALLILVLFLALVGISGT